MMVVGKGTHMPSNASDIYRPYIAGKLQWPIHLDASVCRLFRRFGMIEFGVQSLPSVAPGGGGFPDHEADI
jgi:hypothetical protein